LPDLPGAPFPFSRALTWSAAARTGLFGRPGLFRPRLNLPSDPFPGLYDLSPLHRFLEETIDFGRVNGGEMRVSLAATDLVSGDRVVFDTARGDRIGPGHVVASCALLPLFAPVEVEGRLLGDGGLSGNLPLDLVLDDAPPGDPVARAGDLVFGNQTALLLDRARREHTLRARIAALGGEEAPDLTILLLGYHPGPGEAGPQKSFDYAARAIAAHWAAGERDLSAGLGTLNTSSGGFALHVVPG
jgi:NTE family protein